MATVLIVDDRRDAEKILNRLLTDQGFDVLSLNSAVDLVEKLELTPVDLIIMDMNMPDVDGCEATQILCEHEILKLIPVILCTSDPLPGDEERALQSGCKLFLQKPISKEKLCESLGAVFAVCHVEEKTELTEGINANQETPVVPDVVVGASNAVA